MLKSPFPRSFLVTYILSTSSLGCKALCIVINFLLLWSICLSFSLVHFKKGSEYLKRGTVQSFFYSFDEISSAEFAFKEFSFFSEVLFPYFFFHLFLLVSTYNIP